MNKHFVVATRQRARWRVCEAMDLRQSRLKSELQESEDSEDSEISSEVSRPKRGTLGTTRRNARSRSGGRSGWTVDGARLLASALHAWRRRGRKGKRGSRGPKRLGCP